MSPLNDLHKKRRTDRIDKMRGKDAADQKIHWIHFSGTFVLVGIIHIIQMPPKVRGIDPTILDKGKTRFYGMDIVDSEEARNAPFSG